VQLRRETTYLKFCHCVYFSKPFWPT
jgi:hypothetical protein